MFLFRKHKKLGHKQTAMIGFVLAVMSILVTAIIVYGFPHVSAWLYVNGVYGLDLFLLAFIMTFFLSLQALILFGFPLYYAQDKKSHMTGFRILLYALGWMVLLVGVIVVLTVTLGDHQTYTMDDFDFSTIDSAAEEVVE